MPDAESEQQDPQTCLSCGREDSLDAEGHCGDCAELSALHECIIGYEKPHRRRECWQQECDDRGVVVVSEPKAAVVQFVCEGHVPSFVDYWENIKSAYESRRRVEEVAHELREQDTSPPTRREA